MTTPHQGATRPFAFRDRIDAALILSEAASATLEKNPNDQAVETAAHTLIRAGVGLLSIAETVYLIDDHEQARLYDALCNARDALDMALADDGMTDGPGAVVRLVMDSLDRWQERLSFTSLTRIDMENHIDE
jgi:hypothetical protein